MVTSLFITRVEQGVHLSIYSHQWCFLRVVSSPRPLSEHVPLSELVPVHGTLVALGLFPQCLQQETRIQTTQANSTLCLGCET
jgi:hypothetical protein